MRFKQWLIAILLAVVVPACLYRVAELLYMAKRPAEQPEQTRPPVTVEVLVKGAVQQMELDTYLAGVLREEMPASFEVEALKAQAVAARTYTLKNRKHSQAAVCTDPGCCQAYCAEKDYLAAGHTRQELDRIKKAVAETTDLVLTYEGELIDATYFSCSGGKTEDAVAVWGNDVPYLRAVDSPGEEGATHYVDTVTFSADHVADCLGLNKADLSIGAVTYTSGGGVDSICIGAATFRGTQVRTLLGLRSTVFVMTVAGDTVTVTTKGFGHRVGMSQYGADAMAASGHSCEEILAHYYPGTELTKYIVNSN